MGATGTCSPWECCRRLSSTLWGLASIVCEACWIDGCNCTCIPFRLRFWCDHFFPNEDLRKTFEEKLGKILRVTAALGGGKVVLRWRLGGHNVVIGWRLGGEYIWLYLIVSNILSESLRPASLHWGGKFFHFWQKNLRSHVKTKNIFTWGNVFSSNARNRVGPAFSIYFRLRSPPKKLETGATCFHWS